MGGANSGGLSRFADWSGGPGKCFRRRRRSAVRIRKGSAIVSGGSIRTTAGSGGRAEKKSAPRPASNSRLRSSSSTRTEYYGAPSVGLQSPGGDYQALDFAGAFVDLRDARIAVVALAGVLAAVNVAAA